ncbi:mitotic-spindle organizing gamma-tubulin ring associated-domain-containing protein [Armillaria nabsnona]|nr:mitotic-spindle organizing gamma-tubulin ring associated-domain-containing protein [Armillaria nabsnona]
MSGGSQESSCFLFSAKPLRVEPSRSSNSPKLNTRAALIAICGFQNVYDSLTTIAMSSREAERISSAQQTLDILHEISQLLNTRLDRETLTTCVRMIESGVNPEALAAVIQELRRESSVLDPSS